MLPLGWAKRRWAFFCYMLHGLQGLDCKCEAGRTIDSRSNALRIVELSIAQLVYGSLAYSIPALRVAWWGIAWTMFSVFLYLIGFVRENTTNFSNFNYIFKMLLKSGFIWNPPNLFTIAVNQTSERFNDSERNLTEGYNLKRLWMCWLMPDLNHRLSNHRFWIFQHYI